MSQFKRYLNIINEMKVPKIGLKNAKNVVTKIKNDEKIAELENIFNEKLFSQNDYDKKSSNNSDFKDFWKVYFKNNKHPFKFKRINKVLGTYLQKFSIIRSSPDDKKFLDLLNIIVNGNNS